MINVVAVTDPGRMRERNEDACGAQLRRDAAGPYPLDALVVVADGVGGHDGGDVASRFVVDAVRREQAPRSSIRMSFSIDARVLSVCSGKELC